MSDNDTHPNEESAESLAELYTRNRDRAADEAGRRQLSSLPVDRREYLKATGILAGTSMLPGVGGVAAASDDEEGDQPTPEPSAPDALRIEYERDPENLLPTDETENGPLFSWEVTGSRGVTQSAYRILVSSDPDRLADDDGDVWDSGKVASSASVAVPYDGGRLEPDTTYHWKVRVWNGDSASDWSDVSTFATAIPDTEDHWTGEWIGPSYDHDGLPGSEWTDYTLEAEFTIVDTAVGFLARASGENDCYFWHLRPSQLDVWAIDGGAWEPVTTVEDILDDDGDRHQLEITVDGDEIVTVIDGTVVDESTDSTHDSGSIGFLQFPGEHSRIHSIDVTDTDGEVLFEDDFDGLAVEHFDDGTIEDGALSLDGTEFVLRTESRPAPLLRREFDLEKEVAEARVHVTGLGFYELHVNGERVGDHVLDPGRTQYEETVLYSTYDVTDLLEEGDNAIGAELGRGRFGERVEDFWNWHDAPWWSDPQLLVQCNVEFADGTSTSIVTDESWTMAEGPTRYDSIYGGEIHDARERRPGWTEPNYDDADWEQTTAVEPPGGEYRPQRVQPITIADELEPVEITEPEDGVYVFDVGRQIAGWAELTVEGPAGTNVSMVLGESLDDDGFVENENTQLEDPMHVNGYTLRGDGVETWEPKFMYGGFRYVQVEGYPDEPTTDSITGKLLYTEVDDGVESGFESSNDLLNEIHLRSRQALLNNAHSVLTDTPTFEKNGWTADILVSTETATQNFWMPRFWEKFLQDARDEQRDDGAIPYILPTSGWGYGDEVGEFGYTNDPGWDAAVVTVPWDAYQYYGDERFLEDNYELMKSYVEYVRSDTDGHLVRTGLGDWNAPDQPGVPPEGPGIVSTTLYYRSAEILADSAELLGHEDDAAEYAQLAADIRDAFNDEFFDLDDAVYSTDTVDEYRQTSNVYPLAYGLVPDGRETAVADNLAENVMTEHDGHLGVGVHGLEHLCPVLTEYGHHDVAYTIATQTTHPSWGHWFENGRTGLLEHWPLDARSRAHHFLGTIDQWFFQYLAGIRAPDEPGYERVTIKPHVPDDLESASATTETVRGTVAAAWEQTDDGLALDVTIPGNATAEVHVPIAYEQGVLEDGEPARDSPFVSHLENGDEYTTFEVEAGEYGFTADPVLGGVGFAYETTADAVDRVDDLRDDGEIGNGEHGYLSARLGQLADETADAVDARAADGDVVGRVHDALITADQVEDWLSRRANGGPLAELLETVSDIGDALSYASEQLLDVNAELIVDDAVRAGGTTRVTAALHNDGDERLNDLSLAVHSPDGWEVSPVDRGHAGTLPPGETFSAEFDVTAALGQSPSESVRLTGAGEFRYRGGIATVPMATTVEPEPPVRLADLTADPVEPGDETTVDATLENLVDEVVSGEVSIALPDEWGGDESDSYELGPNAEQTVSLAVTAPDDAERDTDTEIPVTVTYGDHEADAGSATVYVSFEPLPDEYATTASTDARFGMDGDEFVISANGEEVWSAVDEYGALYRPDDSLGDEDAAEVTVVSQEDTSDWANAGLMVRNDVTAAGSSTGYVVLAATPTHGIFLEWDSSENGYVDSRETAGDPVYPCRLRLERDADTFTGYYSTDGETWTEVGSAEVPGVDDEQDVAMYVTSADTETRSTARFDSYTVE